VRSTLLPSALPSGLSLSCTPLLELIIVLSLTHSLTHSLVRTTPHHTTPHSTLTCAWARCAGLTQQRLSCKGCSISSHFGTLHATLRYATPQQSPARPPAHLFLCCSRFVPIASSLHLSFFTVSSYRPASYANAPCARLEKR